MHGQRAADASPGGDGVSMANALRKRGPRPMAACSGSAERGGGLDVFVTYRYLGWSVIHQLPRTEARSTSF